jgi:hypothetical protein
MTDLTEIVARAFIVPLGYASGVDWERVWVGNQYDDVASGSLKHMCMDLATAAIAATPSDPALLAENERLKALLGEADCLTINKGRTITIDFADTQAAGKLFAALQSMHLAKLPQS